MPETSCPESLSSGFKPRTVSAAMTASEKKPPVARVAKTVLKRKTVRAMAILFVSKMLHRFAFFTAEREP